MQTNVTYCSFMNNVVRDFYSWFYFSPWSLMSRTLRSKENLWAARVLTSQGQLFTSDVNVLVAVLTQLYPDNTPGMVEKLFAEFTCFAIAFAKRLPLRNFSPYGHTWFSGAQFDLDVVDSLMVTERQQCCLDKEKKNFWSEKKMSSN